ncbi:hypothetical protein HDV00_002700 [Rhizophlyctis rosea]|nr:hypothetical protein HDV00_002700 [Rhizophlyctis rosea]
MSWTPTYLESTTKATKKNAARNAKRAAEKLYRATGGWDNKSGDSHTDDGRGESPVSESALPTSWWEGAEQQQQQQRPQQGQQRQTPSPALGVDLPSSAVLSAPSAESAHPASPTPPDTRLRALHKKLRQISNLEQKRQAGVSPTPEQEEKVASRKMVEEEISGICRGRMEGWRVGTAVKVARREREGEEEVGWTGLEEGDAWAV